MAEKDADTLKSLVASCRAQMESDLCELMDDMGPALVQGAIARGSNAREHDRRIAASTLKLALSAQWPKVAPVLKAAIAARKVTGAKADDPQSIDSLSILSDAEVAVQLASQEVLDRITTACRDETNPLERRISYLVLRTAMQPADTTFRVKALWECIESACAPVSADANARILLLKLVGEQLATEMPQLFRVVNEAMIEADILPRLKRSYRDVTPVDAHEVAAESSKVSNTLDRLIKARTKENESSGAKPTGAGSHELFSSLKTLQAAPKPADPGIHTNVVRMARDSGAAKNVRPLEAVTLDIVAELFDLIFSDPNVAEGIKALVARLQTTVLRAAMLNQRFFADRSHPARRFLDSISIVATRWGRVVNADDPFYVRLSALVDKVQSRYDGDMAVFDEVNAELDAFLAEREEIEEKQNQELAEAVHAREEEIRLTRAAQMRSQRAANQRIEGVLGPSVPKEIESFLRSYWRDVLQGRISQSGEDGAHVEETLKTAVALIYAVMPKHDPSERKRHAAALPKLLKQLNAGFDEIGAAPSERKAFMDTLVDLQHAALRAEQSAAAAKREADEKAGIKKDEAPARKAAAPTLQVTHATKSGVRVQDISLAGDGELAEDETPDRADLRRVRQLVRGDWVDFITAGQTRRERLTWINHSRSLFLFSNSASSCAISITPEALAVRLRNGSAVIVKPDRPIFERAIQGAIRFLDKLAA